MLAIPRHHTNLSASALIISPVVEAHNYRHLTAKQVNLSQVWFSQKLTDAKRQRQDSNPGPPGPGSKLLHTLPVSALSFFRDLGTGPSPPGSPARAWLAAVLSEAAAAKGCKARVRAGSRSTGEPQHVPSPVAGGGGGGEAEEGRRGEGCRGGVPGALLPAFCWDGDRPVSDGQRSVPRGKAGSAAGTEGDTGGGAAGSGPQGTARQRRGAQILHCCRSLPPPPPQRTSEAKKQRFRGGFSRGRTGEHP